MAIEDMDAIKSAILRHRKTSMELKAVLISNGRRGASEEAAEMINAAGEAMAKSERDLFALIISTQNGEKS